MTYPFNNLSQADIDMWLEANCGVGLPYEQASDLKSALHGAAYTLRQIEGTNKYTVLIGQSGPAASGIRWLLEYVARNELARQQAIAQRDEEVARLRTELRALYRGYVLTLDSGRDRILMLGGDCDSVERMEAGDPALVRARAALDPQPSETSGE